MSHSSGEVWSKTGELLGYFEYNGTVDVVCTRIYKTEDDMIEHWRGHNFRDCICEHKKPLEVILYSSYGGGFYWDGAVCLDCEAIMEGILPYEDYDVYLGLTNGHPFPS